MHHREVSIACDELLTATVMSSARQETWTGDYELRIQHAIQGETVALNDLEEVREERDVLQHDNSQSASQGMAWMNRARTADKLVKDWEAYDATPEEQQQGLGPIWGFPAVEAQDIPAGAHVFYLEKDG